MNKFKVGDRVINKIINDYPKNCKGTIVFMDEHSFMVSYDDLPKSAIGYSILNLKFFKKLKKKSKPDLEQRLQKIEDRLDKHRRLLCKHMDRLDLHNQMYYAHEDNLRSIEEKINGKR
jgi:hypothetical protein